jgi:hypothetical protein
MVNLGGDLGGFVEFGYIARDLGAHVGKDIEVAIAEGMVEQHTIALRDGRGAADDVYDWDMLGKGTCNSIDGGELTNSEGGDES